MLWSDTMTICDRGSIKWTSLMLPEHVKELRKYLNEEYYNIPEPTIDEQQLEEMNELVMVAMEFNIPLTLLKQTPNFYKRPYSLH